MKGATLPGGCDAGVTDTSPVHCAGSHGPVIHTALGRPHGTACPAGSSQRTGCRLKAHQAARGKAKATAMNANGAHMTGSSRRPRPGPKPGGPQATNAKARAKETTTKTVTAPVVWDTVRRARPRRSKTKAALAKTRGGSSSHTRTKANSQPIILASLQRAQRTLSHQMPPANKAIAPR